MYAWGFIIGCILLFTGSLADNWQWGGRAFKWQFMVYAISRNGIKQLGSSFGFIFPSSPIKVAQGVGGGGGWVMLRVAQGKCPAPCTGDSSGTFKQKHDLKSGCKTALFSFFSEQYINNLLLYRRLQIQLLILPLRLYKILAAGLSSLDNYFGNVSYYYIMFVLPIIFAFGSF